MALKNRKFHKFSNKNNKVNTEDSGRKQFTISLKANQFKKQYNALQDPYASYYFVNKSVRNHLKNIKSAVVNQITNSQQKQKLKKLFNQKIKYRPISISDKLQRKFFKNKYAYNELQQMIKDEAFRKSSIKSSFSNRNNKTQFKISIEKSLMKKQQQNNDKLNNKRNSISKRNNQKTIYKQQGFQNNSNQNNQEDQQYKGNNYRSKTNQNEQKEIHEKNHEHRIKIKNQNHINTNNNKTFKSLNPESNKIMKNNTIEKQHIIKHNRFMSFIQSKKKLILSSKALLDCSIQQGNSINLQQDKKQHQQQNNKINKAKISSMIQLNEIKGNKMKQNQ